MAHFPTSAVKADYGPSLCTTAQGTSGGTLNDVPVSLRGRIFKIVGLGVPSRGPS